LDTMGSDVGMETFEFLALPPDFDKGGFRAHRVTFWDCFMPFSFLQRHVQSHISLTRMP
jgi:hypothetical protein